MASRPLEAQQLNPVAPLQFTMVQGGNTPPAQVIEVSSSGTSLSVEISITPGTGGDWLSTATGGATTQYTAIAAINPNVASNLGSGSYTSQMSIKPSNGAATLIIPITLTIVAPATESLVGLAGALNFEMADNGQPPPQNLTIADTLTGSLPWSASTSTSDGGNWIVLSAGSGISPATLPISIDTSNLPGSGGSLGTYTGQILFSSANGSVTVPVSVTVGGNNLVQINPLQFTMVQGGGVPAAQVVQALSSNGSSIDIGVSVSAGSGGDWLTTGQGGTSTPYTAVIGVNHNVAGNLPAGVYTSEVIFAPPGQSPVTVPVTLTIVQPSTNSLANLPGALNFVVKSNGVNPASQVIQVAGAGTGSLSWTATITTSDGSKWLGIAPFSGTTPTPAAVSIDVTNLPGSVGTYTGQILFSSANGSVTVPVSVTVGGNNLVQINPLQFTMVQGGGVPAAQVVQALSSNGSSIDIGVSVSAGSGGDWLTTGQGGTRTPYTAVIGVNHNVAGNLPAGVYTSEVIFAPPGQSPVTVPVTLTIVQPSTNSLANLPGALNFVVKSNGVNPASQVIQVAGAGTGSLSWTATITTSDGSKWLGIAPFSGTTPTPAAVSIDVTNLPGSVGTYTGQILFSSANGSVTVPVSVTVGGNNLVQINPLQFTMVQGGDVPLPQVIESTSSNGLSIGIGVSMSAGSGGDWLTTGQGGTSAPYTAVIGVNHNVAGNLPAGVYTSEVIFAPTGQSPVTVPVTLTIVQPSTDYFNNLPGGLYFSALTGSGNPPGQTIQILDEADGSLSWTAITSTGDAGNWLIINSTSGTTPSTLTVQIDVSRLPIIGTGDGVYTGQILVQSTNGSFTVPIIVQLGNNFRA